MGEYDTDLLLFSTDEDHSFIFCIDIIGMMEESSAIGIKGVYSIAEISCFLWIGTIFATARISESLLGIVYEFLEKTRLDRIESSSACYQSLIIIDIHKSRKYLVWYLYGYFCEFFDRRRFFFKENGLDNRADEFLHREGL